MTAPTPNLIGRRWQADFANDRGFVAGAASAAPRWTPQLAIGILGRVALAMAAVLDLPGRAISPADKPVLHDDIEALIAFFVRTFVMDELLVRQSVMFLFMLADNRCDGE